MKPGDEPIDFCARCGAVVNMEQFLSGGASVGDNGIEYGKVGGMLTPQGGVYCDECAPDVQACRKCGCTDEAGCPEGCCWVEVDLCSSCADKKCEEDDDRDD